MDGVSGQDQAAVTDPALKQPETVDSEDAITPQEEHDIGGKEYVRQKLARRARLVSIISVVAIGGGIAVIALGLFKPGVADRIDHMGTFLSLFFGSCFVVILGYMGLGSYELNNSLVGQASPYGSQYRGSVWSGSGVRSAHRISNGLGAGPQGTRGAGTSLD